MRLSGLRLAALAATSCGLLACSSGENNSTDGSGGASGMGSGGASAGSGGTAPVDAGNMGTGGVIDNASLTWRAATLTDFESYPAPGSDECVKYMGCMYEGQFAAFQQPKTEQWVMEHNIASVHEKDFAKYVGKTLRVRKDGMMIDAMVIDECSDADCSGCCTRNAMPSGFLIDLEKYTFQRMGATDGQAEWACLDVDCPK
jgi:hypothetical protein